MFQLISRKRGGPTAVEDLEVFDDTDAAAAAAREAGGIAGVGGPHTGGDQGVVRRVTQTYDVGTRGRVGRYKLG